MAQPGGAVVLLEVGSEERPVTAAVERGTPAGERVSAAVDGGPGNVVGAVMTAGGRMTAGVRDSAAAEEAMVGGGPGRAACTKEKTVEVELCGDDAVSTLEMLRAIRDCCGTVLGCRVTGTCRYEVTMSHGAGVRSLLDGLRIKGTRIMAKELCSNELVVSFLALPVYIDDVDIVRKLVEWGVEAVSPVRRRVWPGTDVYDGTRYVKVKFTDTVQSLPYSVRMQTHKGPEYFRVIHDRQVRVCRLCIQPGHVLRECSEFRCHKCGGQGHYARECAGRGDRGGDGGGVVGERAVRDRGRELKRVREEEVEGEERGARSPPLVEESDMEGAGEVDEVEVEEGEKGVWVDEGVELRGGPSVLPERVSVEVPRTGSGVGVRAQLAQHVGLAGLDPAIGSARGGAQSGRPVEGDSWGPLSEERATVEQISVEGGPAVAPPVRSALPVASVGPARAGGGVGGPGGGGASRVPLPSGLSRLPLCGGGGGGGGVGERAGVGVLPGGVSGFTGIPPIRRSAAAFVGGTAASAAPVISALAPEAGEEEMDLGDDPEAWAMQRNMMRKESRLARMDRKKVREEGELTMKGQ